MHATIGHCVLLVIKVFLFCDFSQGALRGGRDVLVEEVVVTKNEKIFPLQVLL